MDKIFPTLALMFPMLMVTSVNAATLYVEKWGSENTSCTIKQPCDAISTALDIASPNSRIIVGPGNYQENLFIVTSGIKMESTGGPKVTTIDARHAVSTPAIDVQADRVSIGKTKGKGFTIWSRNADVVRAGSGGDIVSCNIIPPVESSVVYAAGEVLGVAELIAGLRVEGNNLYQVVDAVPDNRVVGCELDNALNPTEASFVTAPSLSAVSVIGDGVILTENNIVGFGIDVIDLSKTTKKSTIKNNNIKHNFNSINGMPGFPFKSSALRDVGFAGILLAGKSSLVSGNYIEKVGDSEDALSSGVASLSEKAKINNNIINNFFSAISLLLPQSVSKNIIVNPSLAGVIDVNGGSSILDNTITSTKTNSFAAGIIATNSRFIRGNNINGFDAGIGLFVSQEDTYNFFNRSFTTISNNNFYDLGDNSSLGMNGACGVFFADSVVFFPPINVMPVKMSKNFFGSSSVYPLIKQSTNSSISGVAASADSSWHICAENGLVGTNTKTGELEVENVTTKASLKPNRIRAVLTINPL